MIVVTNDLSEKELENFNKCKLKEVTNFLDTDCIKADGTKTSFRVMHIAYRKYCERHNCYTLRKGELWNMLFRLGYRKVVVDGICYWNGLYARFVQEVGR